MCTCDKTHCEAARVRGCAPVALQSFYLQNIFNVGKPDILNNCETCVKHLLSLIM